MTEELPVEKGLELKVSVDAITKNREEPKEPDPQLIEPVAEENTNEEEKEMPRGDQSETETK